MKMKHLKPRKLTPIRRLFFLSTIKVEYFKDRIDCTFIKKQFLANIRKRIQGKYFLAVRVMVWVYNPNKLK